jgi:hypothetical protein
MSAGSPSRRDPCLRVVPPPSRPAIPADTVGLSLTSTPFRPGELPVLCWTPLGTDAREIVARRATESGLPAALWLRTAVESARVAAEISSVTGVPLDQATAALDAAASPAGDELKRAEATPNALDRYAGLLSRGEPVGAVEPEVVLRLSEEMAGAWRRAAIVAGTPISVWISSHLASAPVGCVAWEIASARACRTLAEWAYASTLRSMTSSSA